MKIDNAQYNCGPLAVYNALRALGREDVSADDIKEAAGTDERKGTDENGVKAALRKYGYDTATLAGPGRDTFWDQLMSALATTPVIMVVDDNDHWITLIGKLGSRAIVADPENTKANKAEGGVHSYTKAELMDYIGDGSLYGLKLVKNSFGGG